MLMQGYDFYKLHRDYGCKMEFGGDDQWANILGGIELIRRKDGEQAYGMTFTLLTTSEGKKMGKTEKGALWLDPQKVSPYEFYQYWRNVDDKDVIRLLKLVTFLPLEQIAEYEKLEGEELNKVKRVLAYEVTKMVHGQEEADKANTAATAIFGGGADTTNMPSSTVSADEVGESINVLDLLLMVSLIPSKAEGRRLITQGGVSIDGQKITDVAYEIGADMLSGDGIVIKKGKKVFHKVSF